MSAEEMFEKLGYKRAIKGDTITYYTMAKEIHINIKDKIISIRGCVYLTKHELQAINKQCEKLRWYDEKGR